MRYVLLSLAWLPLFGGPIDVTNEPSVTLKRGQTLFVHFGIWNYVVNAHAYPEEIAFSMAFLPVESHEFSGTLESRDGAIRIPLLGTRLGPGIFEGPAYRGPASVLRARARIAPGSDLFGRDALTIRLQNLGEGLTLESPNYTISRAMQVSLEGHGYLVGALPPRVEVIANPEPATLGLFSFGLLALSQSGLRRCLAKKPSVRFQAPQATAASKAAPVSLLNAWRAP